MLECKNHTVFMTKMAAHTHITHIREYPAGTIVTMLNFYRRMTARARGVHIDLDVKNILSRLTQILLQCLLGCIADKFL